MIMRFGKRFENSKCHKETAMKKKNLWILVSLAAVGVLAVAAQEVQPDRVTVPLTDPAKPAVVEVSILRGSIQVVGYEGKEVIVEARPREKSLSGEEEDVATDRRRERIERRLAERAAVLAGEEEQEKEKKDKAAGMKLIPLSASGLTVEEENNHVSVEVESWRRAYDLDIKVPAGSSLKLESVHSSGVRVENVGGEIEAENANGGITLLNVSGTVIASTTNGDIEVVLARLTPDKPVSLANFNGDIDLTLPADAKATMRIKSQQGDVYSDFDLALKSAPVRTEESGKKSGRFRVSIERAVEGTIGGGGVELKLETFNGDIYIRKKK
jgi:hypothetical protein